MFDIGHTLSILRRHKITVALIVFQIALSFAIFSNAVFLIHQRVQRLNLVSGVAEQELLHIYVSGSAASEAASAEADTQADIASLRNVPGVSAAAVINQVPFGGGEWSSGVTLHGEQKEPLLNASIYMGDESLLPTLGVRLVAGRNFQATEHATMGPGLQVRNALITQSVAQRLFPGKSGIGETIYLGDANPVTVIGIVENLIRPTFGAGDAYPSTSIIVPVFLPYINGTHYVLRTTADQRARVQADAVAALARSNSTRVVIAQRSLEQARESFFHQDRSMAWLLALVCLVLLVVTAVGIFGISSFWVQQRTRQFGVRRALGAKRRHILQDCLAENFLLATFGIVLGIMFAYLVNQMLMTTHQLPRLPLAYAPIGAFALLLLGQLSVLSPALRAARVAPALASRAG
jgi:putative ABC transport system permease protein